MTKKQLLEEGNKLAVEENEEAFGILGLKDYSLYIKRRRDHIEHLKKLRKGGKE